jgi:membrane-bound lytic murein transglycosylase B
VPERTRSVETPTAGDAVVPSQPDRPPAGFDPFPNDPSALTVMRDAVARRFRLVGAWSRRPAGRFLVPTLVITAVLAVTGTAGLYLTPAMSPLPRASAADSAAPSAAPSLGATGDLPSAANPGPVANPSTNPGTAPLARPQDALAAWAQKVSPAVGIPAIALRAYGYATLRLASDQPGCHLAWTTLAAIGKVESDHGRASGSAPQPDGNVLPPIIGPALNGQGGLETILDTDGGRYDGDRTYDHAVGPMQFIPSTWQRYQVDADQDGVADPNNLNDAALAAANYLCSGGRDLATAGGWWGAVLSYNAIQIYARNVFDAANDYGQRSRTVA